MSSKNQSRSIDQYVGRRLRFFRRTQNISLAELGEKLGVTGQQVGKYEDGSNRIGAGLLYRFATVLNIEISDFFTGYQESNNKDLYVLTYSYSTNNYKTSPSSF